MGRKGAWGGREPGAEGSLGRKGVWGGWESGADGSLGRKGVWGGREYGAEGSMGRKGALGGPTDRRGFQPALAPNSINVSVCLVDALLASWAFARETLAYFCGEYLQY